MSSFPAAASSDTDWLSLFLEQGPCLPAQELGATGREGDVRAEVALPDSERRSDDPASCNAAACQDESNAEVDLEFLDAILNSEELFDLPDLQESFNGEGLNQSNAILPTVAADFNVQLKAGISDPVPGVAQQSFAVVVDALSPSVSVLPAVVCASKMDFAPEEQSHVNVQLASGLVQSPATSTPLQTESRSGSPLAASLQKKLDTGTGSRHSTPGHSSHTGAGVCSTKREVDTATSRGHCLNTHLHSNSQSVTDAPAGTGVPAVNNARAKHSNGNSDYESVGCIDMTSSPTPGDSGSEHDREPETEEKKRQVRMQRNRESAQLSRQRKKMQMEELDRQNQELQAQNKYLSGLVSQLTAENCTLRHQLVQVCQQTNTPLPAPGAVPPGGTSVPFYGYPGAVPGMPGFGFTPKVPIQKIPPSRPAPAKSEKPPSTKTGKRNQGDSATSHPNKRSKAAAGTAVLALCTLFVFAGPMTFSGLGSGSVPTVDPYAALPDAGVSTGRMLTQVHNHTASNEPESQPDVWDEPSSGKEPFANATWVESNSSTWALLPTQPETALAWHPSSADWESLALQKLMDAGSVALVWDPSWAENPVVEELMPDWKNFPSLLGSSFRTDGLLNPIGCEKVFEVDVLSLPDHDKLKRKMHKYLSSMQGFKGRAVPLPPADAKERQEVNDAEDKPRIGGGSNRGNVVVSVVLPVKSELLSGSGMMAALDRIFVVVLQQSAVYATYSCKLPSLGFF